VTRHSSSACVFAVLIVVAAATCARADVLCKNKKGVLASRTACKSKETQIDPAALGLVGPKGDKGDAGVSARWALVKGDGTIVAQSGGITVNRTNPGHYYVGFGSSLEGKTLAVTIACLDDCTFSGAPQANICGPAPAGGDCATAFDDTSHVGVFVQNPAGNGNEDEAFHIVVF